MIYTINPVEIEIYNMHGLAARVKVFDSAAASVEIKTPINASAWPELAEAVRLSLVMCKLEGDEK